MRIAIIFLATLIFAMTAGAQDARKSRRAALNATMEAEWARYKETEALRARVILRANELRPRRRDTPMRYVGISDIEMREVQDAARDFVPRALVNFSPIVTGCPCEEGPQCTDQIYVLASNTQTIVGLQLVRIKDNWSVGTVQKWWFKWERLISRKPTMTQDAYDADELALLRAFPACLPQSAALQDK